MLFGWWTAVSMNHPGICWLYLCGVFVYAVRLLPKRRKLRKTVAGMEKRTVDDTLIYVADLPVTPSTIGVFWPKIVMPEVILKEYDRKEFQTILLHEKMHIRLGHLLLYLLWECQVGYRVILIKDTMKMTICLFTDITGKMLLFLMTVIG